MSSLLRTWPWRTDDFVLDHNHARQPAVCLDPDGAAHAVWLADTDTIRHNWRVTEIRHAEVDGTQATLRTMTNYRQPVMTPRAVWGRRGLELFVLARFRNRWLVCRPRSSDKWSPVFRLDQHVLSFDVTADADGRVALVYQARLGSGCQIYLRLGTDSTPIEVGRADIPKWRPIITPGKSGRFWVAWEAFHAGQFRVFARQVFPDGGLGPVLATPSDDRFCLDASADVDREGRLWLVCRCVEAWGARDHFLNADAKIVLSCIGTDRVLTTYEVPIE